MSDLSLAVAIREQTGKGAARRLRAVGCIPAVVYGHGKQTVSVTLNAGEFNKLIKTSDAGLNTLFSLTGDACVEGRTVLVKEVQREPVKGTVIHADLFEVELDKLIRVSVPIHTTGTAHGVTLGGLMEHLMREIELDCLPGAIPAEIVVDVTNLEIGDTIHVSELELPEGVEVQVSGELPVVAVVVMKVHELEAEEAEAEEAEEAEGAEADKDRPAKEKSSED